MLKRAGYRVRRDGARLAVEGDSRSGNVGEDIARVLAERAIYVRELTPVHENLESVFLRLTQGDSLPKTRATEGQPTGKGTDDPTEEPS